MQVIRNGSGSLKYWMKERRVNIIDFDFRKKANGLPVLSKKEIDDYAEVLLHDFKPELLRNPGPTPVENFIEIYLDLTVDYKKLSTDGNTLGMIAFNSGYVEVFDEENNKEMIEVEAGTVFIDSDLIDDTYQQGRCRFTFAHEPGHWLFHRHMYSTAKNQMSLFEVEPGAQKVCHKCLKKHVGYISKRDYFSTDEDWQEWQADYFASSLLMPKKTFKLVTEDCLSKLCLSVNDLHNKSVTELFFPVRQMIVTLSQIFDVSNQAAALRLYKLGYISNELMSLQKAI